MHCGRVLRPVEALGRITTCSQPMQHAQAVVVSVTVLQPWLLLPQARPVSHIQVGLPNILAWLNHHKRTAELPKTHLRC